MANNGVVCIAQCVDNSRCRGRHWMVAGCADRRGRREFLAVPPPEVNWEGSQKPIRKNTRRNLGAAIVFLLKH